MSDFPAFMKNPANRVPASQQATAGVEGYVFDGVGGSQMAFWTCSETTASAEHVHGFEEYVVCVDGCYTLIIDGQRIMLKPGQEYCVANGIAHSSEVIAGTRTIHAFGGKRASRVGESD
jgi:quercetin dioxygenase-like cupin family protein